MNAALETMMLVFSGEPGVPGRALFLGAEAHPGLKAWPALTGWQPLKQKADGWDAAGFSRSDRLPDGKWPVVMVLPGKSRDETLAWFALARDRLEPGGRMVVAMPNTAGAGRFEKELRKAAGHLESLQKHKCRAFHAVDDGSWDEVVFGGWRALGGRRVVAGTELVTEAGVFSCDHVDPGSKLLAEHLPGNLRGTVADLGAGWGFLTSEVLDRCANVERVDLFEADARALDCARVNLARFGGRAEFHWHDVAAGLPGGYDSVVMNPPFHSGQSTDVDLGRAFLKSAADCLRRGGRLLMVANRQLPYEAEFDGLGMSWRKVAEDGVYKLLFADKR